MTESQLRAFMLLYQMLRAVMLSIGYDSDNDFMLACSNEYKAIVERMVDE